MKRMWRMKRKKRKRKKKRRRRSMRRRSRSWRWRRRTIRRRRRRWWRISSPRQARSSKDCRNGINIETDTDRQTVRHCG